MDIEEVCLANLISNVQKTFTYYLPEYTDVDMTPFTSSSEYITAPEDLNSYDAKYLIEDSTACS